MLARAAFVLRRVCACAVAAGLAAASHGASAACDSSFANLLGQVITVPLTLNADACNLTYLVVRESGTLTLFDTTPGIFINGASDLSGNTNVQDAGLDNWGLLKIGAMGTFYNLRGLNNYGVLENHGILENRLSMSNFASFTNYGVIRHVGFSDFENFGDFSNLGTLQGGAWLDNYGQLYNDPNATLTATGYFNNRTGATLINNGTVTLQGQSTFETGSTFTNNNSLNVGGSLTLGEPGQLVNYGALNVIADGGDGLTLARSDAYDFSTGVLTVAGRLTLAADVTLSNLTQEHFQFKPGSTLVNQKTLTLADMGNSLGSVTVRNEAGARLVIEGFTLLWADIDHPFAYFENAATASVDVMTGATLSFAQPAFNYGTITNNGTLYISQSTMNQPGGLIYNRGYLDINTVLWNDGQLTNDGGTVKVVGPLPFHGLTGSGRYLQTAGTTQVDGDMAQGAVRIEGGRLIVDGTLSTTTDAAFPDSNGRVELIGGTLSGTGVINGDLFVGGGPGIASFNPGSGAHKSAAAAAFTSSDNASVFTIHGSFTLLAGGELDLDVGRGADGQLIYDLVKADHMTLDGTVHLVLGDGVSGVSLAQLSLLDCGSGCDFGSGFSVVIDGDSAGSSVTFGPQGLVLSIPAAVPEPATLALWLTGLLALAARRSRYSRSNLNTATLARRLGMRRTTRPA